MRYTESQQQSGEYLRLALPLMVRQGAAYHPVSYALWYEHVGGLNPALSSVLQARLEANEPLTEQDAYQLYNEHIAQREAAVFESMRQCLQVLLTHTADDVDSIRGDTTRFTRTLRDGSAELTHEVPLAVAQQVISRLLHEALSLEATTRTLSEKLEARTREVSLLTEQLNQAHSESLTDPLCGIDNRRGFMRAAQAVCDASHGLCGTALIILDVDHFKRLNDAFGHLLGDRVLRSIAEVLRANVKGGDTAARIGGEEFALLLPQTPIEGARILAERIRLAIERGRIRRDRAAEAIGAVTVSLGLALGEPGESIDGLLARADSALYAAKRNGRNRLCVSPVSASAAQPFVEANCG